MIIGRRGFVAGIAAAFAAPAIVSAESLMRLAPTEIIRPRNALLTIDEITRESIRLFANTNRFFEERNAFLRDPGRIGSVLRIRLPNDYVVTDAPAPRPVPDIHPAIVAAAAAPVVLAAPVTRRFWSR